MSAIDVDIVKFMRSGDMCLIIGHTLEINIMFFADTQVRCKACDAIWNKHTT